MITHRPTSPFQTNQSYLSWLYNKKIFFHSKQYHFLTKEHLALYEKASPWEALIYFLTEPWFATAAILASIAA